jgi:hypothetical protein
LPFSKIAVLIVPRATISLKTALSDAIHQPEVFELSKSLVLIKPLLSIIIAPKVPEVASISP